VRAAVLRDRIGGGRKRAIQLLEFFDRVGFTRRVGEGRQRAHLIRGEAPALEDVSG
jgi:selenocysteine-specific elongation factor